jgi:hypothetical protein
MPKFLVEYTLQDVEKMTPSKAKDVMRAEGRQYIIHNVHPSILDDGFVETVDFKQAPELMKLWEKHVSKEEMEKMSVGDALELREEVRNALRKKALKGGRRKSRRRKSRRGTRRH